MNTAAPVTAMNQPTNWTRFYSPKSIAVVGATDDTRRFGGRLMRQVVKFGYAGRILPVNPRLTELNGLKCYPSVSALPETPDHVGVVIAPDRVIDVLRECHAIGVQCATVFTAGYAETGNEQGRKLQEELVHTENRIAFARQGYNDSVQSLNAQIAMFPTNLVAGLFAFRPMPMFEAADQERAAVRVALGDAS